MLPAAAKYVIIGAGIHGLSTAWNLARALRARGGEGRDIVVVDKEAVAAGASGIACGVIRNNYFQPAMRELMAHSVDAWEADAEVFHYYPVGYLQVAPEVMHADVAQIHAEQQEIGYDSELIEGPDACRAFMKDLFDDWQATGITNILHERRGGFANNVASVHGLALKARKEGVRIHTGVTVTGMRLDGGAVTAVETDHGEIACDQVVVAVGPWVRDVWDMLDLPTQVTVADGQGGAVDRPMWTYWALQEGILKIDPYELMDNRGNPPPVVHVDSTEPLVDEHGDLVTDEMWGIYYKPDFYFGGIQGGAVPLVVPRPAEDVAVDPYGPESPDFVVGDDFYRLWTSALAHCHTRLEGQAHLMSREPSGGIGCFTPDSFPVFDTFRDNAYVIADSNHGYKMIGVGALVAKELLGEPQALLEPFRFARYEQGRLHPTSHSPFPWS